VQVEGYKMHRWGSEKAFPSVITVFSAPNYCGSYANKGAVVMIENDKMNIKQYREVEHPFFLPNNLDLFSWSFPFLADKVTEMLYNIISKNENYSPKKGEVAHPDDVDFKKLME
jgi:serine/threonine-protein phosphatase 2B catalytic subunit